MVTFPLSPLMHGGAQAAMLMHLFAGHRTILAPKFDAAEVWRTIEANGVQLIFMTGDAMARPLIEEYDRGDYKADSLVAVASSAAIFSRPVKERWMAAFPNTFFTDSVGSSETGFQGTGLQDAENIKGEGPQVALGLESVVLDEDNRVLDPATSVGEVGRLARSGSVPLGYYKDEAKSAKTFIDVDGVALLGARRLRPDRGGRQGHAARPRLQLHQHRRREGLPRRGRDGAQGPPRRLRRAGGRRRGRELRPGRVSAVVQARGGHAAQRSRGCASSCGASSRATSCRARSPSWTRSRAARPARPTTRAAKELALAALEAQVLMRTALCELFGIDVPIFAFTPSEHVAAAVSRAGGLGVLAPYASTIPPSSTAR